MTKIRAGGGNLLQRSPGAARILPGTGWAGKVDRRGAELPQRLHHDRRRGDPSAS